MRRLRYAVRVPLPLRGQALPGVCPQSCRRDREAANGSSRRARPHHGGRTLGWARSATPQRLEAPSTHASSSRGSRETLRSCIAASPDQESPQGLAAILALHVGSTNPRRGRTPETQPARHLLHRGHRGQPQRDGSPTRSHLWGVHSSADAATAVDQSGRRDCHLPHQSGRGAE